MTSIEWIDSELSILRDEEIIHVFERGNEPRAAHKHMCAWVITNFNSKFKGDPEALWSEAKTSWDSMTPETQGFLVGLQKQEDQMVKDIRIGLLATLAGYQGVKSVKDKFAEAIRSVE
jgi:hypothetical protein